MKVMFEENLPIEIQADLTDFWLNCDSAHIWQAPFSSSYYDIQNKKTIKVIGIDDDGKVCGFGQFFYTLNNFEAVCLRGPVVKSPDHFEPFMQLVEKYFLDRKVGQLRISPYWAYPEAEQIVNRLKNLDYSAYYKDEVYTKTGRVSLDRSLDDIWLSFSKDTRKHIKKVDKYNILIKKPDSYDDALSGFNILKRMRTARGLTPMDENEFKGFYESFTCGDDWGTQFNAYHESDFLGTLWLARMKNISITVGYAVDRDKCPNGISIGIPLWWEGIKWAREKGCILFDVEGYDPDTPVESPLYHIHQHKQKFRPEPVQIISEHIKVLNSQKCLMYKAFDLKNRVQKKLNKFIHKSSY